MERTENKQAKKGEGIESEGSYSADRRYREGVRSFLEREDPEALAKQAEEEVDRDPETFREAEEAGRSGAPRRKRRRPGGSMAHRRPPLRRRPR